MKENKTLKIAYALLTANNPLTTSQIVAITGCERKTVYTAIDALEIAGFITEIFKEQKENRYSCRLNY